MFSFIPTKCVWVFMCATRVRIFVFAMGGGEGRMYIPFGLDVAQNNPRVTLGGKNGANNLCFLCHMEDGWNKWSALPSNNWPCGKREPQQQQVVTLGMDMFGSAALRTSGVCFFIRMECEYAFCISIFGRLLSLCLCVVSLEMCNKVAQCEVLMSHLTSISKRRWSSPWLPLSPEALSSHRTGWDNAKFLRVLIKTNPYSFTSVSNTCYLTFHRLLFRAHIRLHVSGNIFPSWNCVQRGDFFYFIPHGGAQPFTVVWKMVICEFYSHKSIYNTIIQLKHAVIEVV